MSYGFDLFPCEDNCDEDHVFELLGTLDENDADAVALEARNQQVALAIRQQFPHFRTYTSDFSYEFDTETGIQIFLSRRTLPIGVSLPYWYGSDGGWQILGELKQLLLLMQSITRYAIYDSQVGKILDLNQDWGRVLRIYGYGVGKTRSLLDDKDNDETAE